MISNKQKNDVLILPIEYIGTSEKYRYFAFRIEMRENKSDSSSDK